MKSRGNCRHVYSLLAGTAAEQQPHRDRCRAVTEPLHGLTEQGRVAAPTQPQCRSSQGFQSEAHAGAPRKAPVTKRRPRAVRTRRCRRSRLVHGHHLQNAGRESLSTPPWLICSLPTDPMDCSTPGLPASHRLPEFTQVHLHRVSDALQPSHPLPPPSPFAFSLSQHQGLFQ